MAKDYKSQLLDKRWQIKKSEILFRDNHTCQNKRCKTPDNHLEVHHLMYLDNIFNMPAWLYPSDMLITLCDVCHTDESWRPILEKSLANTLKMKGFLMSDLLALSSKLDSDLKFTKTLLNTLRDIQNG